MMRLGARLGVDGRTLWYTVGGGNTGLREKLYRGEETEKGCVSRCVYYTVRVLIFTNLLA